VCLSVAVRVPNFSVVCSIFSNAVCYKEMEGMVMEVKGKLSSLNCDIFADLEMIVY